MKKTNGKRFSKRRKGELVLRLLRGETLEDLSRETGRPAYELAKWRDQFLDGGYTAFSEPGKEAEDLLERYKALLGCPVPPIQTPLRPSNLGPLM